VFRDVLLQSLPCLVATAPGLIYDNRIPDITSRRPQCLDQSGEFSCTLPVRIDEADSFGTLFLDQGHLPFVQSSCRSIRRAANGLGYCQQIFYYLRHARQASAVLGRRFRRSRSFRLDPLLSYVSKETEDVDPDLWSLS
jgi:hypothetical protein